MTMRHYSDSEITMSSVTASMAITGWWLLGAFAGKSRSLYYRTRGLIAGDRILREMLKDRL